MNKYQPINMNESVAKLNGFPYYNIPLPDRPSDILKPPDDPLGRPGHLDKQRGPANPYTSLPPYSSLQHTSYVPQQVPNFQRFMMSENVPFGGKTILRPPYKSQTAPPLSMVSGTPSSDKSSDESVFSTLILEHLIQNAGQQSPRQSLALISTYSSVPFPPPSGPQDAPSASCEDEMVSEAEHPATVSKSTKVDSTTQSKSQSLALSLDQIEHKTYIQELRQCLYDSTLETPQRGLPNSKSLKVQNQSICRFLSQTIPIPCFISWPNVSPHLQWRWTLGAMLEEYLKENYLNSSICQGGNNKEINVQPHLSLDTEKQRKLTDCFLDARKTLKDETYKPFDPFDSIAPCYNYAANLQKSLQGCSLSVVSASPGVNKGESFGVPLKFYLNCPKSRYDEVLPKSCRPEKKSQEKNDLLENVWLFNTTCGEGWASLEQQDSYTPGELTRRPFRPIDLLTSSCSAKTAHEAPWDMEEVPVGRFWNDHVMESVRQYASSHGNSSVPSIFWGEYTCDSSYLATLRYLHMKDCLASQRSDVNDMMESFESMDSMTEQEVHLQKCLLHSLQAYQLDKDVEKAFAFSCCLLDTNDHEMFFTTHPPKNTKGDFLPLFHPHDYEPTDIDESLTVASSRGSPNEKTVQEDEDVEDIISSSSGLLSDVVDDASTFMVNGMANVTLASVGRDRLLKDRKDFDKTLQLKKRSQEKEKRIRLALLGLAPHVARNVEPSHSSAKATDDTTVRSPDSTAVAKPSNAVKEYRELRRRYRHLFMMDRLNTTLDYTLHFPDPYSVPKQAGIEERDCLELQHSRAAFLFLGVASQLFLIYAMRFHRPDFRTGLYELLSQGTLPSCSTTGRGHSGGPKTNKFTRFILNLGRSVQSYSDKVASTGHSMKPNSAGFPVRGPCVSNVFCRARANNSSMKAAYHNPLSEATPMTGVHPKSHSPMHPAMLIEKAEDLTLTDTLPIGLFEYSEQSPPLLNNLGMVAQVTKYYRPSADHVTLAQARKKIRGRLGRFGRLKLADSYIPFFASQMRLARNQGVVVFQSRLFKAPIFPHPTNPHCPLKQEKLDPETSRYGTGRFHDFRATDFLLIRKKISLAGKPTYEFFLRPLFLEVVPSSDFEVHETQEHGNRALCTVYTVGQTQPFLEVPLPHSKRCLEIRRNWLRAYALRLARHGITDFQTIKARCQAKFNDVFESGVLQKHLLSCRDPAASQTSPGYSDQGLLGPSIRVVSEESIQAICPPEMICTLESSMISHYQLSQAGVLVLRTPDRVSTAVRELEAQELVVRDNLLRTKKTLASSIIRYEQFLQDVDHSDRPRHYWEEEKKKLGNQHIFFDMLCGKRYGPIARVIEEMLLLTPWNITRDCLDVVTRHGAQFCLDGLGDPSGGRCEGISLIRAHGSGKEQNVSSNSTPKNVETPKEDLRKLSMKELHDRLIKFGFDSQIVKSLPRWDQVALVRTFQYDNSRQLTENGLHGRPGRLSSEMYLKRINEIFLNQRIALEPDEPQLTPSDSDSSERRDMVDLPTHSDKKPSTQEETFDKHVTTKESPLCQPETQALNLLPETNLEDELLSGLQCQEQEIQEGEQMNEKTFESIERRALKEFRESLSKSQNHSEAQYSSRLAEKFSHRQLQFLEAKPIPRVVWSRKKKDYQTGELILEKTVHIYGYENIRLFYEWRKKQNLQKQGCNKNYTLVNSRQMGTASRTCRRCGQIGHISSNPICPQYTGTRKARGSQATNKFTHTSFSRNQHHHLTSFHSSDDDRGLNEGSLTNKLGSSQVRINTAHKRGRRPHNGQLDHDIGEPSHKIMKHARGKDNGGNFAKMKGTSEKKLFSSTSKLPTRTTARQRLMLENKGTLAGAVVQSYQGTYENAVHEINQIFQRVISKTDRDKRKWAVFREKVSEADAPGYNSVITNPIWLNKIVEKCKAREYRSTSMFLNDIQLLVDNCFRYNPPGHWILPLVQSLGDFLKEETASQGPWLVELDRFIQNAQEN